jgi:hypothetical protein
MTNDTPLLAAGRFIAGIYRTADIENSLKIAFAKDNVCN